MFSAAPPTLRVRQVTMKSTICLLLIGISCKGCLVLNMSFVNLIALHMLSLKALRIQWSKSNFSLICDAT
jgi:hypothetical protein